MLCENSKILLDYKSERTVTKQSVRFTVLRSKAVSRLICDKQHQPQLVCLQHVNGTSKSNVSDASTLVFPDFLRAQNMVRVMEGKII